MIFGSLLRLCSFAIGAGLAFLLSPQEPDLNWPQPLQPSIWKEVRATVFDGLRRVKADLDSAQKNDQPGGEEILRSTKAAIKPVHNPAPGKLKCSALR